MTDTLRIPATSLIRRLATLLEACDVAPDVALVEAQTMVAADLHEVPSHGVRMLAPLMAALREGRVCARPQYTRRKDFGACCFIDCDNGPGRHASLTCMDEAITRARAFGIGLCLATRTTHWGRAHAYACHAAQQGLIGICTTNAMPTMAAWGAKTRVIGNNPLAIGIPRQDADHPMVLDMAMSQAAVGKVNTWLREGHEVPQGWGIDAQGQPSTDAKAILDGAVLPFAGHKGTGLALMMELMTAALANGAFGHEIVAGDRSGLDPESTKLFIAINPEVFGGRDAFTTRVGQYLDYIKANAGTGQGNWPGERGWEAYARNLEAGVPLHQEIFDQLVAAGMSPD